MCKCVECGVEFALSKWSDRNRVSTRKYCSTKCKGVHDNREYHAYRVEYWRRKEKQPFVKNCNLCGADFETKNSNKVFCSEKCRRKNSREKHKDKRTAYNKEWLKKDRARNPEKYRFLTKQRRNLLRVASNNKSGKRFNTDFTQREWEVMKSNYNYTCYVCNRKEPEIKLTIDHIVPLSRGGEHSIANIQPLCHSCNSSKKDRLIWPPARHGAHMQAGAAYSA